MAVTGYSNGVLEPLAGSISRQPNPAHPINFLITDPGEGGLSAAFFGDVTGAVGTFSLFIDDTEHTLISTSYDPEQNRTIAFFERNDFVFVDEETYACEFREPPEPSAPVFASEPGTLDEITEIGTYPLGFTLATGHPSPTYVASSEDLPDGVLIIAGENELVLPAVVPAADVESTAAQFLGPLTDSFTLTMTATNSEGSDTATATVPVDIPVPAPVWSAPSYAVELPVTAPQTFGNNLSVTNCDTIRVAGVPDKGVYYIDDGDDTPLALNDEFPVADLALLTGESDGDTGAVTGVLKLRALGSSNVDIDITVTIAAAAGPDIDEFEFEIEEGTVDDLPFDTETMGASELASVDNQTTGDSAVVVLIPDHS